MVIYRCYSNTQDLGALIFVASVVRASQFSPSGMLVFLITINEQLEKYPHCQNTSGAILLVSSLSFVCNLAAVLEPVVLIC
jgi:hypothetical protein